MNEMTTKGGPMKTEVRARCGGAVAVLSGVAFLAEGLLYLAGQETVSNVVLAIAYPLAAAGLVGFTAGQGGKQGLAGRLGSYAVPLGWAMAFLGVVSGMEAAHGVGFLVALVGYLLYGVAKLRARVLPRWCGIALVAVGPVSLMAGEYTTIALGLPLGAAVWTDGNRQSPAARTAMA